MRVRLIHLVASVVAGLALGHVPLEAAADTRAVLSLVVNRAAAGESLVILRGDGDALIPVTALESAGVKQFQGTRETFDSRDFVSLHSLVGIVTFELDEAALELRVQASAESYARRRLDLRSVEPAGTQH